MGIGQRRHFRWSWWLVGPPRRPRDRARAQLLRECCDVAVGLRFEFPLQQFRVGARVLERPGAITRRIQTAHQSQGDAATVRIMRGQSAPPLDRCRKVARVFGSPGQFLQCRGVALAQPRTLAIQPALEFGRTAEVKPIE